MKITCQIVQYTFSLCSCCELDEIGSSQTNEARGFPQVTSRALRGIPPLLYTITGEEAYLETVATWLSYYLS